MINIPWILAKCKKSSDLRNCRKIYRHPNYGPAIIQVGSNFLPKIAKKLKKWNFKHFFWFTKVISAYFAFFGLLFLCMPDLWPKGFTYRKFQVVMINGSEIMTSSILKNLCQPKMLNIWLFLPIFILNISAKAIKSHFLYWISKSLMVLGFSEWHLDLPKMLPT